MRWIVRHAAWLIPRFRGSDVQSPFYRAMSGPYRGKLVEFGESVLAHLPDVGKGSGNPAPKLADRWKSAVWLGKSDLTDEHLVRTDDGVVCARSVRRLAEHSWSTPQRPKTTIADIRLRLNISLFLMHHKKHPRMRRKNLRQNMRKTEKCRGEGVSGHRNTRSVELKQRREAHRDTR